MKLCNPVKGARLLKYPAGNIYQFFGENVALYQQAIGTNGHNGIDIVSAFRTPILMTGGKVVEAKNDPTGYGKWIRILTNPDENGDFLEVTYGHEDEITVKLCDKVINEQEGGKMGNTGFVISGGTPYWGNAPAGKGVHLHFGVRECSTKNTGWQSIYASGDRAFIKNYDNGLKGSVDPMKFLDLPEDITKAVQTIAGLITALQKKVEELLKVGRK